MKFSRLGLCAFWLSAVVGLSGCGQSQPAIQSPNGAPQATPFASSDVAAPSAGWLSAVARTPKTSEPIIYVSHDGVALYPETGGKKAVGRIAEGVDGAYGLYVDQNGTLYVANAGDRTVTAYPAGSKSYSMKWSQDLGGPLYPIVDSKGDLFVSNSGNGTVVEYLTGSTNAYQVLQTPGVEADGMDFDAEGDLYVAYRTGDCSTCGGIEEFPAKSTQGQILGMVLNQPQGLIVDSNNDILVVETGTTDRIDLFEPGEQTPSQEVPAPSRYVFVQLAIEANETELFVSANEGAVFMTAYPFPTSPTLDNLISIHKIQGIALSNGQTF